jgi:rhodanese-related sulfurtransferase
MYGKRLAVLTALVATAITVLGAETVFDRYGDPRRPEVLQELIEDARDEFYLIDVRTPAEYDSGYIPTATNIDYRDIADELTEGDRSQPIVLYCRTGNRSGSAERALRSIGYTNIVNFGGIFDWPFEIEQGE